MAPYERFQAWQLSYKLVLKVYAATDAFPKYELYGLTSQTRRAAFSVTLNIAEGSAKRGGRGVPALSRHRDWLNYRVAGGAASGPRSRVPLHSRLGRIGAPAESRRCIDMAVV